MSARPARAKIGSSYPSYATQLVVGHHHLVADEPVDLGGGDTGPAPDELVLGALGACTAITLRMYAERKQWPLESVEVSLDFESRTKEKAVIRRTVHLGGPLSPGRWSVRRLPPAASDHRAQRRPPNQNSPEAPCRPRAASADVSAASPRCRRNSLAHEPIRPCPNQGRRRLGCLRPRPPNPMTNRRESGPAPSD